MVNKCKNDKLDMLCTSVRKLCAEQEFDKCYGLICKTMSEFPHAAIPHNLLGIVLEKTGDHLNAMKHFRAAWALDPTYRPANQNLHNYGTFYSNGKCAFDENDVPDDLSDDLKIVYNKRGIGHIVSKKAKKYENIIHIEKENN